MRNFISPNFGYKKLQSLTYEDLVDVFEDRMRNWFFQPASHLLEIPHCEIAAVGLLANYFEGIEIYITGQDSKGKSKPFFVRGFGRVFPLQEQDPTVSGKITDAIYNQVRCGFAHDGMFRNRVFFSRVRPDAILLTWPKKNGALVFTQVESIVINPPRFYECIKIHFDGYMKSLREAAVPEMKRAFRDAVALKWGLEEPDRIIGMTQDDFLKT